MSASTAFSTVPNSTRAIFLPLELQRRHSSTHRPSAAALPEHADLPHPELVIVEERLDVLLGHVVDQTGHVENLARLIDVHVVPRLRPFEPVQLVVDVFLVQVVDAGVFLGTGGNWGPMADPIVLGEVHVERFPVEIDSVEVLQCCRSGTNHRSASANLANHETPTSLSILVVAELHESRVLAVVHDLHFRHVAVAA